MPKLVPLTQGQFAIVDDEDFEWLSRQKWHAWWNKNTSSFYARGYIRTKDSDRILEYMHRVIMGAKRGQEVDHIHKNTLDNRKSELRACSATNNRCNRSKTRANTSGFKGVIWDKGVKKWRAQISANNVHHYLGLFRLPEDAARAYDEAAKKYHGAFAKTNF